MFEILFTKCLGKIDPDIWYFDIYKIWNKEYVCKLFDYFSLIRSVRNHNPQTVVMTRMTIGNSKTPKKMKRHNLLLLLLPLLLQHQLLQLLLMYNSCSYCLSRFSFLDFMQEIVFNILNIEL